MIEDILISPERMVEGFELFGIDRVRRGMQAFPRIPMGERAHICDCFVGLAWREGHANTGSAYTAACDHFLAMVLSYAYEHQTTMLHAVATDWLAQQDAIAEVTQPGLVRASL